MSSFEAGYFILGLTNNGQKFRPSDWIERVATVCGCFDERRRLQYNPMLKPAFYDGNKGLFVDIRLETLNPNAYNYAISFSLSNNLQMLNIGQIENISNAA